MKIPLQQIYHRHQTTLFFLFFLGFWFGLLSYTGTLTSGFHFMDDHEIVRLEKELAFTSLGREMGVFINHLVAPKMRFRPFYVLQRRLGIALLGADFTAWSVYFCLIAVITSFLLFRFLRHIGFSPLEGVLFVFLTLVGPQAEIYWRLGTGETHGMLFLAAALFFLIKSFPDRRHNTISRFTSIVYEILFLFFSLMATWSKESFILVLPALAALFIWFTYYGGGKSRVLRKLWIPALLLILCVVELLHLLNTVGTGGTHYAGYDGFQLSTFFRTARQSLMAVHGWIILVQAAVVGLFLVLERKNSP